MNLGILILPEHSWEQAKYYWQRAEALGFSHAWTYDHLTWRSFRDQAWYAALPTLTAAALATNHIQLGTMVASPNFRHPVPFTKELITLDNISAGRFILGIGAGSSGWDATSMGQKPWTLAERSARFAEFVQLTDQLLRQPEVTYQGMYYQAREARNYPGCVQRPRLPLAIAATGPRGLGLVARFADIWITNGDRSRSDIVGPSEGAAIVRKQWERLVTVCERENRDPATIRRLVLTGPRLDGGLSSLETFRDTVGHYAEIGVTDLVLHWPRASAPYAGNPERFEQLIADWQAKDNPNAQKI
ncbi:MAG: LLM class flavin-dependent oxidoreductase [Ardenticatenales bacterium]|nr:LLM class flavin-dependent oxidoreductase [Ardenticatenales bacterium]